LKFRVISLSRLHQHVLLSRLLQQPN